MNYSIDIALHFPHDRFALGWQYIAPEEKNPYSSLTLYLLFCTINIDYSVD